jgi:hypothetical protein
VAAPPVDLATTPRPPNPIVCTAAGLRDYADAYADAGVDRLIFVGRPDVLTVDAIAQFAGAVRIQPG